MIKERPRNVPMPIFQISHSEKVIEGESAKKMNTPYISLRNPVKSTSESDNGGNSISLDGNESEQDNQLSVNAYRRRNVYKSVIRHMLSYIRKNRDCIIGVLKTHNFSMQEIEHAFFQVSYLNELERQKGKTKRSQTTINGFMKEKTIYTYILRETLYAMMQNWKIGKTGKISQENLFIYREVCENYYKRIVDLVQESAQGTEYLL